MSDHNITKADLDGLGLEVFDPAQYIGSDEAAAAYINEALAANDAALLASAIGDVARARGMTEIAKSAGITREALYKALRLNSQPRMETIARVLGALKLRLVVEPIVEPEPVEAGAARPLARKAAPKSAAKLAATPAKRILKGELAPTKALAVAVARAQKGAESKVESAKAPAKQATGKKASRERVPARSRRALA